VTQVFVAQHPTEAHLVRGLLEAEGIQADVRGESLFGARGEAPVTPDTLPTVWVLDDNDVAKATQILAGYGQRKSPGTPQSTWQCPDCGEQVEAQFGECWKCGAAAPQA
jgi:hypothetical protein